MTSALRLFADEVGAEGPVAVEGGRTQWQAGGAVATDCRFVRAPSGIVTNQPAEMTVRVGAGTPLAELHNALGQHQQTTLLDGAPEATVGGLLAVGQSGIRRFSTGSVRDTLLEARYVSAAGRLVTAGGPTVKNVTGFDVCRLLVGSLGTLGLLGEVVLRTRPMPETSRWVAGAVPPQRTRSTFFRPASLLWDGETTWVLLEGYGVDVEDQLALGASIGLSPVDGPPELPPHRWSVAPADVRSKRPSNGRCVAEFGVGILHCDEPPPPTDVSGRIVVLHQRLKSHFDPTGRLNPGRDPLNRSAVDPAAAEPETPTDTVDTGDTADIADIAPNASESEG